MAEFNYTYKKDATFCKIINIILPLEAGFVNHPKDPGGPTNRGIAWNYNQGYLKAVFGFKTWQDIKNITKDQACQCYYDRYWLESNAHGITDVDLAFVHMDAAVNCGVGAAKKFLSRLSRNPKNFDGTGGKNRTLFLSLFLEYIAIRLDYYTDCRNRDAFLEGWVNRIVNVIREAKDLD